ncbi:hypothetical protein NBO_4g0040 [Nosema bombycis CQ1]|uniref:Uncharacterized protein n=1 Tax=Nosema bombycis (strain CQ1 / CVCC 102059) TaxID=578461 RepID=R0KZ09_NOSB1|nr:hypothetical protein NBO_4g0040 [Nosema bombycis CQ1]|eukprot:EOB15412.1 hypothetical protein NBO_4g0040 [Nosema bombycis CQ1]
MRIILLIYLITASKNCFDDKGIDLYNKYSGQGPNRNKGSDLSSYMASPVSQNILQGNSSMIPGQNSGCADQKQMYYMQGRVPYSQGGLINSLMGQPFNQRVFTSSCGRKSEEEKYRDCVQKQIQDIKNMVMTCKSIYGEDSNMCCVDGGCLSET